MKFTEIAKRTGLTRKDVEYYLSLGLLDDLQPAEENSDNQTWIDRINLIDRLFSLNLSILQIKHLITAPSLNSWDQSDSLLEIGEEVFKVLPPAEFWIVKGKIVSHNDMACLLTGYTANELRQNVHFEVFRLLDKDLNLSDMQSLLTLVNKPAEQYILIRKSGLLLTVDVSISAKVDTPADDYHLYMQKSAELDPVAGMIDANHPSLYKFALDSLGDFVWIYEFSDHRLYFSKAISNITGYTTTLHSGDDWRQIIHPDDLSDAERLWKTDVEQELHKVDLCFRVRHALGHYIWLGTSSMMILDNLTHQPTRVVGIGADVTLKKEQEILNKELQTTYLRNLQSYEQFFNSAMDFMFITDAEGIILNFNLAVRERLHYGDELIGQHLLNLHPEESRSEAFENLRKILTGELKYCPLEILTKEGERIQVESTATMGELDGKPVMFGISRDVSDIIAMEEQVKKNELTFRRTFEDSAAGTAIYSLANDAYISINKNFTVHTGYTAEDVLGKSNSELNIIPDLETRDKIRQQISETGSINNMEIVIRLKNGDLHTCLFCATLVEMDEPVVITTAVDIEEIKKNQQSLEEQIQLRTQDLNYVVQTLTATLEALPDLMFMIDAEGNIHDYHSYHTNLLYAPREVIVGNNIDTLLPPDVCIVIRQAINETLIEGYSRGHRYSLVIEKTTHWFELSIALVKGEPTRMVVLARDITEHVRNIEMIIQSESKYKALFYDNETVLMVLDPKTGTIVDANTAACNFYGYTQDELLQMKITDINILSAQEAALEMTRAINKEKNHFQFQHRLKDGTIRDVDVYAGQIMINNEPKLYSVVHDVTSRIEAEKALAKNREVLSAVIEGSDAGYWDWDIKTGVTTFNERWASIIGYTLEELQPTTIQTWMDLCHPEDLEKSNTLLTRHFVGQSDFYYCEARMKHKDGHWVWILDRGKVVEWDAKRNPLRMSGTHIDYTVQKQAQLDLVHRVTLEKTLTAATTELLKAKPENIDSVIVNSFGLIGKLLGIERINFFVFDQDTRLLDRVIDWVAPGISSNRDIVIHRDFNQLSWVMQKVLALEPFQMPETHNDSEGYKQAEQALQSDGVASVLVMPVEVEGVLVGFVGFESLTEIKTWQPEDMVVFKSYHNALASTLVKNENLKQLIHAKAIADESNKIKNTFLANINHELRTPLNGLSCFLELLDAKSFSPEYQEYLGYIKNSTQQLVQIVDDMLSFNQLQSGSGKLRITTFDLRELVDQIISTVILEAIRKGIRITSNLDPQQNWQVCSDHTILKQILLSLVNNAIKFTSSGTVVIRCDLIQNADTRLTIAVSDTGIGIPSAEQDNIFKEFYQIDSEFTRNYGGTGMGLAVVKKYLDLLQGEISLQSMIDRGSTFTLNIPVQLPPAIMPDSSAAVHKTRKGRILVVEDNAINLKMMILLLQRNGFDTVSAHNGKEALDLAIEEIFDAILMDIQMPVMDGITATELIRKYEEKLRRHTPIIAVTAHVSEYDKTLCINAGMDDVVHKPVNYEVLIQKIQKYRQGNL
jgi:PAS domain S-box-containing protein